MNVKTILICFTLCLVFPTFSQAGLRLTPADVPVPVFVPEPPKSTEYAVKSGDTLGRIGKKHGVTVKEILAANKGVDPNKLQIGQKLVIPGKQEAPKATKAVAAEKITAEVPAKSQAKGKAASGKAEAATASGAKQDQSLTKAKITPAATQQAETSAKAETEAKIAAKVEAKVPARAEKPAAKDVQKTGKQPLSKTLAAIKKPQAEEPPHGSAAMRSYGKTGVIMNNTDVPQAIREEFNDYGRRWLNISEELAVGTKNNKKVRKVGDKWEASYRIILKDTMGTEVKRVHYEHTPYVGHLTYGVLAYVSVGPTKEAALGGSFVEKEEHMREIFSYDGKKKAWR